MSSSNSKEIKAPKIKPQYLVVSGAFLIFALLFLQSSRKYSEKPVLSPMDARVQLGISYVQGGGAPMIGIGMLKDVLKEEPENKYALWTLGTFSQQSGQHDKAIQRFEDLLNIEVNKEERVNVYTALEFSLISTNQVNRALLLHERMMKEFSGDSTLVAMIEERNKEIKNRFINVKKD